MAEPVSTAERDDDPAEREQRRRLAAIEQLRLLDGLGDPVLTGLTRLARSVTGAGAAAVHIFDKDHQRRIAAAGAALEDHPAADSMCQVVLARGAPIVTPDATADARFAHSSFVSDPVAPVRFYASVPLRTGDGVPVGTLCAFDQRRLWLSDEGLALLEEIAEIARAHLHLAGVARELGQAAAHDPLTGAVNRVIFHDRLAQALARRRRHQTLVLVAVIDLDDFKALNDTHGHRSGDGALRWTVGRLRQCLREEDTVGRLGGDEFAVIAEIRGAPAEIVLDRVHRVAEGFDPPFGVSVGAVIALDSDDVESVLRRADEAMYAAKPRRRGRG